MWIIRKPGISWLGVFLPIAMVLVGCSFLKAKKDIDFINKVAGVYGRVQGSVGGRGNTIVVALSEDNGDYKPEDYTSLDEQGLYLLIVPEGEYSFFSFIDHNQNRIFDVDEPSGYFDNGRTIEAKQGEFLGGFNIYLGRVAANKPVDLHGLYLPPKKEHALNKSPGVIVDLDESMFSSKVASLGYYAPIQFLYEYGGNIYFTKEYDSKKTPVLFIHGVRGSPLDFKKFGEELENKGYQTWFGYWATGGYIDRPAVMLNKKLKDLYDKYQFHELHIVAHSMGGLTVRDFLINYGHNHPYIKTFTSIATPWGGVEAVRPGVEKSPIVLLTWRDILPESDFIERLYSRKLPPSVKHFLFYAVLDDSVPGDKATDGIIPLSSQTDARAKSEASVVHGFQNDHVDVLSDERLMEKYLQLIQTN